MLMLIIPLYHKSVAIDDDKMLTVAKLKLYNEACCIRCMGLYAGKTYTPIKTALLVLKPTTSQARYRN